MAWAIGVFVVLACAFGAALWQLSGDGRPLSRPRKEDTLWPDKEPEPPPE